MLKKLNPILCLMSLAALLIASSCGNQPKHPNQLNQLDGTTYDSMTAAHGALVSLRADVALVYPKYSPVFNQAAGTYATAFNAYAAFRTAPSNPAGLSIAINNLTISIVSLENTFAADMHANARTAMSVRHRAQDIRSRLQPRITISDILTELEIAATVAQSVPQAQPYASMASMVIQATSAAMAAQETASGQPIDIGTIQPVPAI